MKCAIKVILVSIATSSLSMPSMVLAFDLGSVVDSVSDGGTVSTEGGCIPRNAGGSVSLLDKAKQIIIDQLLNKATEVLETGVPLVLPKPVKDTCEADKRLKYVSMLNTSLSKSMAKSMGEVAKCYDMHDESKKLEAEAQSSKRTVDVKYIDEASDELAKKITGSKDTGKIGCASGAAGGLKGTLTNAGVVLGWDKELSNFAKDNIPWAINNLSVVKEVMSTTINLAGGVATVTGSVVKPIYEAMTPYDKKKAEKLAKKAQAEQERANKQAEANAMDERSAHLSKENTSA